MLKWTQDNSKWSQEGSILAKMDPKGSPYGARWPKEVAKIARNDSEMAQGGPRKGPNMAKGRATVEVPCKHRTVTTTTT